jgi:hypothetical protein
MTVDNYFIYVQIQVDIYSNIKIVQEQQESIMKLSDDNINFKKELASITTT